MASNTTRSASTPQEQHGEAAMTDHQDLNNKLRQLKKKIADERIESIKEKLERNKRNLQHQLSDVMSTISRNSSLQNEGNSIPMLSRRIDHPLCKFRGTSQGLGEDNYIDNQDIPVVKSIKLPYVERLPPYTFWIHLAKNERMAESIVGRKKIYYDQHEGETLLCSDSDEELKEHKKEKRDFSQYEDQFLRMAIEEHGFTEKVLRNVKRFVGGTISNIQERYQKLKENDQHSEDSGEHGSHIGICLDREDSEGHGSHTGICLDRSLSAASDNFDHLFCRQCMIYDCPLHGCSQPLIYPSEQQPVWSEPEDDRKPCSDHCYLRLKDVNNEVELKQLSNSMEEQVDELPSISHWKLLEKELYLKGIEMFGRNSCLIYRNLLSGLKNCMEVATYMRAEESMRHRSMDENGNFDTHGIPSRSRRKSKARRFRFTSKSTGLPSMWKRITDGNNQIRKHYTPCGCKGTCGKQCPCFLNGSCCEKYCGCSKLCRIRFRGCHCVKSQCRSRQCPCFAALRECDPDVCRNCWVSCGGGSLGEPHRRGDGQCENMRILLRKKQRILLAKSDIAGWGAFVKNPANKNDYLGEYTGELVSQVEAEKRGKLYDRADFSFLFTLNDEYVLDAYRKGDKLKFANHSFKPNCYAKIMLVCGDHRVGIFAKKRIEAGEELFYDYHYAPHHRPPWFTKLLDDGSEQNESTSSSQGKAKKY